MTTVLKTEIQARINAATIANTSTELGLLRLTGTELGCDLTNLDAVAVAVANTTDSSTPLIEMAKRAKALAAQGGASALEPKIPVALPFSVQKDDVIYADDFGYPHRNGPYTCDTLLIANSDSQSRDILFQGEGNAGPYTQNTTLLDVAALWTLPDGDKFLAFGGSPNNTIQFRVVSPDMKTVKASANRMLIAGDTTAASYVQVIGVFPTETANQYALYYLCEYSSSDTNQYLLRRCLVTYNPATNSLTSATPTTVFSNGYGTAITLLYRPVGNTRYALLKYYSAASTIKTAIFDTRTGTLTEHVTSSSSDPVLVAFIVPEDGILRWLVRRATTVTLLSSISGVSLAIPTNVATLFADSNLQGVSDNGSLVVSYRSTGAYRLVRFSSDASAADIFTLGTDGALSYSGSKLALVKHGNSISLMPPMQPPIFTFSWDGSAVTSFEGGGRDFQALVSKADFFDCGIETHLIYSGSFGSYVFWTKAFASSVICMASSPIGIAEAAGAAGEQVQLRLFTNAVPIPQSFSMRQGMPYAFGFRVVGRPEFSVKSEAETTPSPYGSPGDHSISRIQRSFSASQSVYVPQGGVLMFYLNSSSTARLYVKTLLRRGEGNILLSSGISRGRLEFNHPVVISHDAASSASITKLGESL